MQGGRLRSLAALAVRLTRRTPSARTLQPIAIIEVRFHALMYEKLTPERIPEIQALKNVIVAFPGFESDASSASCLQTGFCTLQCSLIQ